MMEMMEMWQTNDSILGKAVVMWKNIFIIIIIICMAMLINNVKFLFSFHFFNFL